MLTAPLIGINRHRIETDGRGITTLVAFYGCPLRCKYCLNPKCFSTDGAYNTVSTAELISVLEKDELYYLATGGGVTFGGGEPLLYTDFIIELLESGAKRWNITIESSLNVPQAKLEALLPYIDEYIIDIKDTDADLYKLYTGTNNTLVLNNLQWLIRQGKASSIHCRLPLIPGINTYSHIEKSKYLLSNIGITRFDEFEYITNQTDK